MGSPECFYRARPAANFKTTGAGERSARVRYLPAPALTGSIPLAKNTDAPTQGRGSPSCKQHFVLRTTSSDSLMKKQVSSPFTVFVPVILTGLRTISSSSLIKKSERPFLPFGLLIVELAGIEPATSSMPWKRATNCAIAPKAMSHLHKPVR